MEKKRKSGLHVPRLSPKASARVFERLLPASLAKSRLRVPMALLDETLTTLQRRSEGWRESAAIWSGHVSGDKWNAMRADFHHKLCDDRANELFLELSEAAKFQLYQALAASQLRLVALVHTHPEDWVDLSSIDRENQLCSRLGFWSLVVPNYGRPPWSLSTIGVHVRVENGWHRLTPGEIKRMVHIQG
jgi:proteasome lid subunit RPN8/RPN11